MTRVNGGEREKAPIGDSLIIWEIEKSQRAQGFARLWVFSTASTANSWRASHPHRMSIPLRGRHTHWTGALADGRRPSPPDILWLPPTLASSTPGRIGHSRSHGLCVWFVR